VSAPVAAKPNPPQTRQQQSYLNGKGHISPASNINYTDDRQDEILNYEEDYPAPNYPINNRNSYYMDESGYDDEHYPQQPQVHHHGRNGYEGNYHPPQQNQNRNYARNDPYDNEPKFQPNQNHRAHSPKRMMATTGVQTANINNTGVQTEDRQASISTGIPQAPILVKSTIPQAPSLPTPQPTTTAPPILKSNASVHVIQTERPFENGSSADPSGRTQTNIHIQKRLDEELKKTLKERDLDIWRKTKQSNLNDPMINEYSPTVDIREWLLQKGFSPRTISILEGQSGATLFALSKNQLQQFCGKDEGKLLYSQLLVQKSLSGYDTKTNAELKAILQVRKSKAETANQSSTQEQQPQTNALTKLFVNTNDEAVNGGAQS
jgi:hypothetical protein